MASTNQPHIADYHNINHNQAENQNGEFKSTHVPSSSHYWKSLHTYDTLGTFQKKKKAVAHHPEFFFLNFRCTLSTFIRAWLLTFKVCTDWWLCNGADGSDLKLIVCERLAVLFSHLWHLWSQWNAMIPIKPHTSCKYFYIQPTHAQITFISAKGIDG